MTEFETFFHSFIETALWCSSDMNNSDTSLQNQGYDICPYNLESLKTDCQLFFDENYSKIQTNIRLAGHDFWLTSNRHGAGFWDGDWEEKIGKELTDDSHKFSEHTFYVNDGVVYCD